MLIWDNASWHVSKQVKTWLREHNQTAQPEAHTGKTGVRIIPCWLPIKSPWLNRIEPKWVHGKRAISVGSPFGSRAENFQVVRIIHDAQDVAERIDDGSGDVPMATVCGRFERCCTQRE